MSKRKIKGGFKQLCWKCAYACDKDNCIWVNTLEKTYPGTKFDKWGNIIDCPNFKHDEFLYDNQEKAIALGVTLRKYTSLKAHAKKYYPELTPEEYYKKQQQKLEERKKFKALPQEEQKRIKNKRTHLVNMINKVKKNLHNTH